MMNFCRDAKKISGFFRAIVICISLFATGLVLAGTRSNGLVSVNAIKEGSNYAVKIMLSGDLSVGKKPNVFSVVSPAKIVVDLPDVTTSRPTYVIPIGVGDFDKVYVAQLSNKTRLVFSLKAFHSYDLKQEGDHLVLSLTTNDDSSGKPSPSPRDGAKETTAISDNHDENQRNLIKVDFKKGEKGSGVIVLNTNVRHSFIRADRVANGVLIYLPDLIPYDSIVKSYDVSDFSTPIQKFSIVKKDQGSLIRIYSSGVFEDRTFESQGKIVIELKKVVSSDNSYGGSSKRVFVGKKLSLHFQNTTIRGALQAIADFTGLNILVTDGVKGSLTMRLNDVPWDQALNIVLESGNLGMRRNGSVIVIGTSKELLESEKQYLQSEKQMNELAQTRSVVFHLNYQKANDVEKMLGSKSKILSERGSVIVDNRTNQLFIRDVPDKIREVRDFIKAVDVPVSQVMIEARIVEANSTFNRSLGVRLGTVGNNETSTWGSSFSQNAELRNNPINIADIAAKSLNINLPATATSPGKFAWTIFNADGTSLLNLEISALEADGDGKTLANPRVVTSDKQQAIIEQGTEIPYTTVQGTGANVTLSTEFKKVNLSLSVTPQITPNNHVILDVEITKDSVGVFSTTAGPAINTKHVKTQVLVENGGTLVIGGIYEDARTSDHTKVPLLGDIPVIGNLFQSKTRVRNRSELMVFITPRVLYEKRS
ncbi:type IV pilus secretin family protein [Candidatus Ichthyocystis hellenicum]|uniref:type IV pilus secretin family protein n=1 Tax=Candidatus Ichthyocystis hellenicum TaxID=1561003 RepID=UPI000AD44265|nr:type IV pilus secretin family protein [Candidatus Ichthyocystis hellenicum]